MGRLEEVASDESSGEKSKTFVLKGEGYTLGNALTTVINENPDVYLCSCSMGHPSDGNIYLKIVAKKGKAIDILKLGLQQLEQICDYTLDTFNKTYEKFKTSQEMPVDSA